MLSEFVYIRISKKHSFSIQNLKKTGENIKCEKASLAFSQLVCFRQISTSVMKVLCISQSAVEYKKIVKFGFYKQTFFSCDLYKKKINHKL